MIDRLAGRLKHISVHYWGIAALAAALATGQASLSNIAGFLPDIKLPVLCLIVAITALAVDAKMNGLRTILSVRRNFLYLLGLMVAVMAAYFVRDAYFLPHELGFSIHVYIDMLMVFAFVALAFCLLRDEDDVSVLMLALRLIAFLAACGALAKAMLAGTQLTHGALQIMGGPYGFYTLQLMGFGATLFAMMRTQSTKVLALYTILGAFYLVTAFFSLQKAAPVAAFLGVFVCVFALVVLRYYKRASFVGLSFVIACAIFFFPTNISDLRPNHTYVAASPVQVTNQAPASENPLSSKVQIEHREYADDELPEGLTAHMLSYVGYELRTCYIEAWKQRPDSALLKSLDVTSCGDRITIYDSTSRLRLFLEAQKIIKRAPLFGEGVDSYRFITVREGEFSVHTYPHNIVLNLMVRFGLIGTLLLISPLLISVVLMVRHASAPVSIALLGIAVLTLATCLVAGDFYEARVLWLLLPMTLAVIPEQAITRS